MEVLSEYHLKEAAKSMELAVEDEPSLLMDSSYLENDVPWNTRYKPVLCRDKYKYLSRKNTL